MNVRTIDVRDRLLRHLELHGSREDVEGDLARKLAAELDLRTDEVVRALWSLAHDDKIYVGGEAHKIYLARPTPHAPARRADPILPGAKRTNGNDTGDPLLLALRRNGGRFESVSALAGAAGIPMGTISARVAQLVRDGLIVREPVEGSRRTIIRLARPDDTNATRKAGTAAVGDAGEALESAPADGANKTGDGAHSHDVGLAAGAVPAQWDPLESTCRHASLSIL